MWDLVPWPGMKPRPLHLELRVLAAGPPGKPPSPTFSNKDSYFSSALYHPIWTFNWSLKLNRSKTRLFFFLQICSFPSIPPFQPMATSHFISQTKTLGAVIIFGIFFLLYSMFSTLADPVALSSNTHSIWSLLTTSIHYLRSNDHHPHRCKWPSPTPTPITVRWWSFDLR